MILLCPREWKDVVVRVSLSNWEREWIRCIALAIFGGEPRFDAVLGRREADGRYKDREDHLQPRLQKIYTKVSRAEMTSKKHGRIKTTLSKSSLALLTRLYATAILLIFSLHFIP